MSTKTGHRCQVHSDSDLQNTIQKLLIILIQTGLAQEVKWPYHDLLIERNGLVKRK